MTRALILLALCAMPASADQVVQAKTVDCYCTDATGTRVELGQHTCLHINGRRFMARCGMSQNVPIWRDTGEDCLTG